MKIGIVLYPLEYPNYAEYKIREAMCHICFKYNLDDVIFVGFKGTDPHMCCKGFPYHFGRNEDNIKVRPLELCSRGLHFCWELDAVFDYYPLREFGLEGVNNRYFIALPEGPICYGTIKMCSNVLNILEEIPRDMAEFYHEELRNGKRFAEAIMRTGLYELTNNAVNEFIAKNKNENGYVNLIPYNEGGEKA